MRGGEMTLEATVGVLVIIAATLYWIIPDSTLERLWEMITMERALSLGGFSAGLVFGDVVIKAVVGAIAGFGVLGLSDVLDIGPVTFAGAVGVIIIALAVTRDSEEDDD